MIGKIGGIVLKVAIPFVILAMILIPYLVVNVEVNNDKISFKSDNIEVVEKNKIAIFDVVLIGLDEDVSSKRIINLFDENSKTEIILYSEVGFLFLLIDLIIMILIFKYVENLFKNIKNNITPFILDNVNYIKRISYLMISLIVITSLSGGLFNFIFNVNEENVGFDLISILEILIIFSMSYIFEYGYEIQKDSNGKMYTK